MKTAVITKIAYEVKEYCETASVWLTYDSPVRFESFPYVPFQTRKRLDTFHGSFIINQFQYIPY